FARTGYWSVKRGQNTDAPASLAPDVAPGVQDAVKRLADSLRPNAEEPTESPRRILMPQPASVPKPPPLLAEPTVALMHGRVATDPVPRREFRRTDTILIRGDGGGAGGVGAAAEP